jgi:integrase
MSTTVQLPTRPTTAAEAKDAYLTWLKRNRRAENTLKKYRPYLRDFAEWAGERHPASFEIWELDDGFLAQWEDAFETRNGRPPSDQSRRGVIGCLSSFYGWLHKRGLLVDGGGRPVPNPMLGIEPPRIKPRDELDWLSEAEQERLLSVSMTIGERTLITFLVMTGLRLSEALKLRQRDVDLASMQVNVRESKTARGIRSVAICDELKVCVQAWLNHLRSRSLWNPDAPFFITRNLTAMKPQQAELWVKGVGESAELSGLTPHRLRRTLGSYLIQHGRPLYEVSLVLGHADTRTTEMYYARLTADQVRAGMLVVMNA